MNRKESIENLKQNSNVTVLIIGAGINGIGTFRDLALQGVDVVMVDRADFCGGASAASSHMVHGGIRYLENGEFRLVREAVHERNRLLENAPHYAKPLPTTIPMFKWFSGLFNAPLKFIGLLNRPAERGGIVIKFGLIMYDAFTAAQRTVPAHTFVLRDESLRLYPQINPEIVCTATYYDGIMPAPERICIELVLDGQADAQKKGSRAAAINYMSLVKAGGDSVTLRDELSGETIQVRPKVLINAAGPWIDIANQAMGQTTQFIGGTKGSHIIVNHPELRRAIGEHEFFFENFDGRIVLLLPILDKVMIGTSDLAITDPDSARCDDSEIEYFLGMTKKVFPGITIERSQIVFRFTGVRPLPSSKASLTGQISRDHSIRTLEAGGGLNFPVLSLIGGKWTTFRAFSEKVTDAVLQRLNLTRRADTKALPIGGGRAYPTTPAARQAWLAEQSRVTGVASERLTVLFERYGTRAAELARLIAAQADQPLRHKSDFSRAEVAAIARLEYVTHLDDFLLRRSLLGMLGELTLPLVEELAEVIGEALDWPAERRRSEVERARHLLAEYNGVKL